jgi:hypothetical protein
MVARNVRVARSSVPRELSGRNMPDEPAVRIEFGAERGEAVLRHEDEEPNREGLCVYFWLTVTSHRYTIAEITDDGCHLSRSASLHPRR